MAQQQKIAKADHRRQQIVEVVRDAARQLADSLHLLRLGQLFLKAFSARRVDEIGEQLRATRLGDAGIELRRAPSLARQANLDRVEGAAATGRGKPGGEADPRRVLHQFGQRRAVYVDLRPGKLAEGVVRFDDAPAAVEAHKTDRCRIEEAARARPAAIANRPWRTKRVIGNHTDDEVIGGGAAARHGGGGAAKRHGGGEG